MKSNTRISSTPSPSTHSVSNAMLGTTRSYTFIENSGNTSANTLTKKAAISASRYSGRPCRMACQNQCWVRALFSSGTRLSKRKRGLTTMASPL
ncbi:hypothetical protein D3C72_1183980 [compost metagenome]